MTNEQILAYYVGLLIMQYTGSLGIQTVTFSGIPASGTFNFTYGTLTSASVSWNDSNPTIIGVLETLTGYTVTITAGSLAAGTLTISFGNNQALVLGTANSTLETSGAVAITTLTSGDLIKAAGTIEALSKPTVMNQLPLIAQNAFNLIPTIQTITFSSVPGSGHFAIQLAVTSTPSLALTTTASINYNDSNQSLENSVNAILPSGSVSVSGGLSTGVVTLTFNGVNPNIVAIVSNTTGDTVTVTTNIAYGSQLDTIGKYVGVSRFGDSSAGPVTLDDADFYQLIQLGIITNNFGSSLAQIQSLLFNFFQGHILVFDYTNMQMSYIVNSNYFSTPLIDCIISQGLLPRPMGVQLSSVIIVPGNLFSFRTYILASSGFPFNNYDTYVTTWPWVSYADAI